MHGLYGGGVLTVYVVLLYLLEFNLFSPMSGVLNFVIPITVIVFFMVRAIKGINIQMPYPMNYWSKFFAALFTGITIMVIYSFASFLIYFVVDPEMMRGMIDQFLVSMEERLMNAGITGERLEQQMTKLVKRIEKAGNPLTSLRTSLISSVVMSGILALIVAAAVNTKGHHEREVNIFDENEE